jgi:hypothetical protein
MTKLHYTLVYTIFELMLFLDACYDYREGTNKQTSKSLFSYCKRNVTHMWKLSYLRQRRLVFTIGETSTFFGL